MAQEISVSWAFFFSCQVRLLVISLLSRPMLCEVVKVVAVEMRLVVVVDSGGDGSPKSERDISQIKMNDVQGDYNLGKWWWLVRDKRKKGEKVTHLGPKRVQMTHLGASFLQLAPMSHLLFNT